ncbi:MAG: hypothetical protein AAGH89_17760 [Verrucomicrobiota bacterium]
MKSLLFAFCCCWPLAVFADSFAPGLLVTEFPRLSAQVDSQHVFVPHEQFGEPIGERYVVESASPWNHKTERNAIARGFLRIDADGDYAFTTNSFYDRNMLMIDGKVLCGFVDGGDRVESIFLRKGLVEFVSVGYVLGRGSSEVTVQWRPPYERELGPIPSEKLVHETDGLLARSMVIVAKDFVIDAYINGERIPRDRRRLLLDRYGASVERINVSVSPGDWLVFQVAHNQLRHGGSKYFAVAGCLDHGRFGFESSLASKQWTVCDDPAQAREFIVQRNSSVEIEKPATAIDRPWEEGMKFMRQYGGANFSGTPLWGHEPSTWIKFRAPKKEAKFTPPELNISF